jgi:hypothetical protein
MHGLLASLVIEVIIHGYWHELLTTIGHHCVRPTVLVSDSFQLISSFTLAYVKLIQIIFSKIIRVTPPMSRFINTILFMLPHGWHTRRHRLNLVYDLFRLNKARRVDGLLIIMAGWLLMGQSDLHLTFTFLMINWFRLLEHTNFLYVLRRFY